MLKYFLWFAFALMASVFVTSQHEKNAKNATSPCWDCAVSTTTHETKNSNGNRKNSKWYSPSGVLAFKVFGWPNGITVWTLFLTMMVISEQTKESAKAAKAAKDAAVSAAESANVSRGVSLPALAVHRIGWDGVEGGLLSTRIQFPNVRVEFKNHGQTTAFLKE
jgi:hypothetical protein